MSEPLFQNIDGEQSVTEIESLCMNCHEQGTTKLLLTKIPHFKELLVMAFYCPHCGFQNNETQPAAVIAEQGMIQTCRIETKEDLNRQIIKSESATVKFIELDFEIPSSTEKGSLSPVEGLISRAIEGLSQEQPVRKIMNEEIYLKIEAVIDTLKSYLTGTPFTVEIDDPAGNSYIENLCAPNPDPKITTKHYTRTPEQEEALGLQAAGQEENNEEDDDVPEVMVFPGNCSRCNAPSETKMHVLDIPHFKEVVIMSTVCESCGFKSNEVKAGGAISPKGKRYTLIMDSIEDLSRDILKSETCGLKIPEIEIELNYGTLGGRFTTIEGLLTEIYEELDNRNPFSSGDSAEKERKETFQKFLDKLKSVLSMDQKYTLILDDPLANSYLQNPYAPDDDPNMTVEYYERTFDQNEDLGLNDIVVSGYEQEDAAE
ncbi:hypothetical protein HK098_001347 [Nowakowskiella sp. JEL0407]|nr:hypothetical protein HK098_001347 [Nowakowskiella sp. JEL0407]